ncbi:hypothetical protein CGLO_16947 [Colletotrichum gloeosporioides Cg-14]|uniref:Uncharacterized protein n=1 Tax=Colletotrichum gloeosporioides (strain Cg-14) TaxID=1237896 RepID=T0L7L3_COLGC|nr:hypothetical protein CGLO_16947 [Colletotrichum gloeosporioides Cg-14]
MGGANGANCPPQFVDTLPCNIEAHAQLKFNPNNLSTWPARAAVIKPGS